MTQNAASKVSETEKVHAIRPYPSVDQEFAFAITLADNGLTVDGLERIHFAEEGLPQGNVVRQGVERDENDDIVNEGEIVENTRVIDADYVLRYKDNGFHSATLMQATEAQDPAIKDRHGMRALCDMLALNNGMTNGGKQGGYLKDQMPRDCGPFAQLLRVVQKVDLPGLDHHASLVRWIAKFQDVCSTYFSYAERFLDDPNGEPRLELSEVIEFSRAYPDLAEKLKIDIFADRLMARPEGFLTLTGYAIARNTLMTDEERAGGGEEKLVQDVQFWLDGFHSLKQVKIGASAEAKQLASRVIPCFSGTADGPFRAFMTKAGRVIYIETDSDEASGPLFEELADYNVNVIVSRQSTGRAAILTRAGAFVDTAALAAALEEREPDRWHDERRLGKGQAWALLNGSKKILKEATALTTDELEALCKEHLKFRARPANAPRNDRNGRRNYRR